MPGEDFLSKWLPLILTGASVGGSIVGSKIQAGSSDRAAELQSQSAQKQLDALLTMYGLNRNDLAPYRAAGTNALANMQTLGPPSQWKPGSTAGKYTSVPFSQFKPDQVSLPPALSRLTTAGSAGGNAMGGSTGTPRFDDIPTAGIHSRLGGIGGNAMSGAGLGATAGSVVPGIGTAAGAAGGAMYGAISGLWDNNNSDKNFATTGINRVSDWTWNTLMPKVRSGEVTPDDAEAQFNSVWSQWESSMRGTKGFNSGVADKSVSSQKAYFKPFYDEMAALRQKAPPATA